MRVSAFVFAIVFSAGSFGLAGQTPQLPQPAPGQPTTPGQRTPPRGAPPRAGEQPPAGTAVLRGQVVSVDGTPLRRAMCARSRQKGAGAAWRRPMRRASSRSRSCPPAVTPSARRKAGYVGDAVRSAPRRSAWRHHSRCARQSDRREDLVRVAARRRHCRPCLRRVRRTDCRCGGQHFAFALHRRARGA